MRHPGVRFLVTTSRAVTALAERAGPLDTLRALRRARSTVDTCPLATPMLPPEIRTLMTNSAKYAYYAPGLLNTQVIYGSLADCVRSAVEGRVVRDEALWDASIEGRVRGGRRGGPGNCSSATQPLSFWGGYDAATGEVIDRRHPLSGQIAAGRVLAIPFTRWLQHDNRCLVGSRSRAGVAPAAILTAGTGRVPGARLRSWLRRCTGGQCRS